MSDRMGDRTGSAGSKRSSATDKYAKMQKQAAKEAGALSWADAGPEDLLAAVAAATEDGAAILLSKTSDGGALVIRVITDAGSTPFYPAQMSALSETLSLIVEAAKIA